MDHDIAGHQRHLIDKVKFGVGIPRRIVAVGIEEQDGLVYNHVVGLGAPVWQISSGLSVQI